MFDDLIQRRRATVDTFSWLAVRDFDSLDLWIAAALRSITRGDDASRSQGIATCYGLYAAYNLVQRERQWYLRACEDARDRETRLREALVAVLESIAGDSAPIEGTPCPNRARLERPFSRLSRTSTETGPCRPNGNPD